MANMIIKPAVGGNLLIQDRAGGAVLSTGASGATMASNVTGIPAAGVTGVLPAGVTGGSGLTALGTVATGNLSNTALVYPAGHVIKITKVEVANHSIANYDGSQTYYGPTTTVSMTSGNRMLITWQCTIYRQSPSSTTTHSYMGLTGTGVTGTLNNGSGRPSYISYVTNYRIPTADTYNNGTAIILSDVVNATSGTWGTFMDSGVGGTGVTFTLGSQIAIFQEIQT